jgi:hypothetical protein
MKAAPARTITEDSSSRSAAPAAQGKAATGDKKRRALESAGVEFIADERRRASVSLRKGGAG